METGIKYNLENNTSATWWVWLTYERIIWSDSEYYTIKTNVWVERHWRDARFCCLQHLAAGLKQTLWYFACDIHLKNLWTRQVWRQCYVFLMCCSIVSFAGWCWLRLHMRCKYVKRYHNIPLPDNFTSPFHDYQMGNIRNASVEIFNQCVVCANVSMWQLALRMT